MNFNKNNKSPAIPTQLKPHMNQTDKHSPLPHPQTINQNHKIPASPDQQKQD